jgi:hypothetical protein
MTTRYGTVQKYVDEFIASGREGQLIEEEFSIQGLRYAVKNTPVKVIVLSDNRYLVNPDAKDN